MADRQPHLNGAYYGPAVPPPTKTYHRPGRGSGCGCCGCLGCLGCCFLSLIFKIIFAVVIIIGIAILILWLIFRPNMVKFNVTDASLTQFNFPSNDNNLHYDLNLTLSIRNPNKRIGINYDYLQATAYYENNRFSSVTLPTFYQGHKNTTDLEGVFQGQQLLLLGGNQRTVFNEETSKGVYTIDVKLSLKVRFKVGLVNSWTFKPNINCNGLQVPLSSSNGTSGFQFQSTGCRIAL